MGRPPKQTSLFWRETRQRILGHEISPYPEVVRGREWELAAGQQRGEQQKLAWKNGQGRSRPDTGAERRGSMG